MTPNKHEAAAIADIFTAANKLSNAYAVSGGAENRRDQLIAFTDVVMQNVAVLAGQSGADQDTAIYGLDSMIESIVTAFVDVIEAEEASEPDMSRPYSTLYVQGGSVVG